MLRFFSLLIILTGIKSYGFSQESDVSLTLGDAIETTLDNNFQIKITRNLATIASNNNTYGNAGFLPSVNATANYSGNIQNTEQEFASGTTQSRTGAKRKSYGGSLGMVWTLFDGTKMFATKDRLENEAIRDQFQLKVQIDNTLSNLMSVFYQLAFEQERLELFNENLNFSRDRIKIVENKYNVGKESKIALLQAKVDFNSDQSLLVQQNELLTSRKLDLIRIMGVDPFDFVIEYEIELDSSLLVDELLSVALSQNPFLLYQEVNRQVIESQVDEINRSRWPTLDMSLGYGNSNLESEAGFLFRNQTTDFNYGLTARVNLFNGFNLRRQMQNAEIQLQNSEIMQDDGTSLIETSILATYNSYRNNLDLAALETQNLDVATENSKIALDRFRLGVSDALELREAQINTVNAQIRFLQAQFNAKQAEIELLRLSGQLTSID